MCVRSYRTICPYPCLLYPLLTLTDWPFAFQPVPAFITQHQIRHFPQTRHFHLEPTLASEMLQELPPRAHVHHGSHYREGCGVRAPELGVQEQSQRWRHTPRSQVPERVLPGRIDLAPHCHVRHVADLRLASVGLCRRFALTREVECWPRHGVERVVRHGVRPQLPQVGDLPAATIHTLPDDMLAR